MPRAACAEQIALLCSAVLCAFVTGVTWGKKQGAVKDQIHAEKEKRGKVVLRTQQHALYPVLLYVRKKAHSAATQHRSEGHGTAPHGSARLRTAPHGATLLAGRHIAGLI